VGVPSAQEYAERMKRLAPVADPTLGTDPTTSHGRRFRRRSTQAQPKVDMAWETGNNVGQLYLGSPLRRKMRISRVFADLDNKNSKLYKEVMETVCVTDPEQSSYFSRMCMHAHSVLTKYRKTSNLELNELSKLYINRAIKSGRSLASTVLELGTVVDFSLDDPLPQSGEAETTEVAKYEPPALTGDDKLVEVEGLLRPVAHSELLKWVGELDTLMKETEVPGMSSDELLDLSMQLSDGVDVLFGWTDPQDIEHARQLQDPFPFESDDLDMFTERRPRFKLIKDSQFEEVLHRPVKPRLMFADPKPLSDKSGSRVLSVDRNVANERHTYVFVDTSGGHKDKHRAILIREPNGVLRTASEREHVKVRVNDLGLCCL
jgi:hypothetical protein